MHFAHHSRKANEVKKKSAARDNYSESSVGQTTSITAMKDKPKQKCSSDVKMDQGRQDAFPAELHPRPCCLW